MKDLAIFLCGLVIGLWLPSLWGAEEVAIVDKSVHVVEVKRSLNGLCHPVDSQFYNYIKFYIEYDSLNQCVLEGGRLPVRVRDNVSNFNYDSDTFTDYPDVQ